MNAKEFLKQKGYHSGSLMLSKNHGKGLGLISVVDAMEEYHESKSKENMVETLEKLLQNYASYSYLEGTIDENTMLHLIKNTQNYIAQFKSKNLLNLKDKHIK